MLSLIVFIHSSHSFLRAPSVESPCFLQTYYLFYLSGFSFAESLKIGVLKLYFLLFLLSFLFFSLQVFWANHVPRLENS